jgi:hypothetical protein
LAKQVNFWTRSARIPKEKKIPDQEEKKMGLEACVFWM